MGEAENVELMRRAYEHWNATGELDTRLFDPDVVWDNPVGSEGRIFHGIEEVRRGMADLFESYEFMRNEPERIEAAGNLVVVVSRTTIRGRASGLEVENRAAHVWTVREGRAARFEVYEDVPEALRLVGAGP